MPTTARLTVLDAYSATSRPAWAAASSTTPLAWPSLSEEAALTLTTVSSTAAALGRCAGDHLAQAAIERIQPHRQIVGRIGRDHPGVDEVQGIAVSLDHAPTGASQPGVEAEQAHHADSRSRTASSTSKLPTTFWTSSLSSSISSSLNSTSAWSEPTGTLAWGRQPSRAASGGPRRASSASRTAREVVGSADDLVSLLARAAVFGTGLDRRLEHGLGVRGIRAVADLTDPVELVADAAGLAERAAELGECGAHLGRGAVAIVGQRLDDQRDAAGAVALVAHLLVSFALGARAAPDRALNVVLGHVGGARRLQGRAQARVGRRVGQAGARRDLDLADQPRELSRPLGVLAPFAVHDVLELRVTGHDARRAADDRLLSIILDREYPRGSTIGRIVNAAFTETWW